MLLQCGKNYLTPLIYALNIELVRRSILGCAGSRGRGVPGKGDSNDKGTRDSVEQVTAYSRSVYDIAAKTQAEFGKIMEQRFAAFNRNMEQVVDDVAKSAPAGSAPALAAIRQTLAATNAMVDTLARTAKQFAEAADTNIKSAAAAATNVAKGGARKKRG